MSGFDAGKERIVLSLLELLERDGGRSQRHLASELGIALGLVNAYLRRCLKKGLLKVHEAPARRYAYYLTPQGFAEKSRLTVEYLSHSFGFFRKAKADCQALLLRAKALGIGRIVIVGSSDLAEIITIFAPDLGIQIMAIIDPRTTSTVFAGVPVFRSFEELPEPPHAIFVTDLLDTQNTFAAALQRVGQDRVFMPMLLGYRPPANVEAVE